MVECYEIEAKFDDSYERHRECIAQLVEVLDIARELLVSEGYDLGLIPNINPTLARAKELLK